MFHLEVWVRFRFRVILCKNVQHKTDFISKRGGQGAKKRDRGKGRGQPMTIFQRGEGKGQGEGHGAKGQGEGAREETRGR
jgi:hypothetical protein